MPKVLYLNCLPPKGTKNAKVTTFFEQAYLYAKSFPTVSGLTGDESSEELIQKAATVLRKKFAQEITQASYTEAYTDAAFTMAEQAFIAALAGSIPVHDTTPREMYAA